MEVAVMVVTAVVGLAAVVFAAVLGDGLVVPLPADPQAAAAIDRTIPTAARRK